MERFIYGLAVVLLTFVGIINQCEGTGHHDERPKKKSRTEIRDSPSSKPTDAEDLVEILDGIAAMSLEKTDYKTKKMMLLRCSVPPTDRTMNNILQQNIFLISPRCFNGKNQEYYRGGDVFEIVNSCKELFHIFETYGDKVKRIQYWCGFDYYGDQTKEIHDKTIKKCAKNLEELRIYTENDETFWEALSDDIPSLKKVKHFQIHYHEHSETKKEFKLDEIFPVLESVTLSGAVADKNCLANVKNLTELMLYTDSIKEDQFEAIFQKNPNLKTIALFEPKKTETMHAIAEHLQNLKTLKVEYPGELFLSGSPNSIEVPSVEHFYIKSDGLNKDFSFYMPKLKKLHVRDRGENDNRIIEFVGQHSKTLETLELFAVKYHTLGTIGKLKHIKEFVTFLPKFDSKSLLKMLKQFDKTFELETLKFMDSYDELYKQYKAAMEKINIELKNASKLMWTISDGHRDETGMSYIMFKRNECPCNWKPCKE